MSDKQETHEAAVADIQQDAPQTRMAEIEQMLGDLPDEPESEEGAREPEPAPQPGDNDTDWEEEAAKEQPEPQAEEAKKADKGDLSVALRQEREEARQLREQLAAQQARTEQLERLFMQRQQPEPKPEPQKEPEDPEPELPDINEVGIEEYIQAAQKRQEWKDRQQERETTRVREWVEQQRQQAEQAEQQREFGMWLQRQENGFRETASDYDDALAHLVKARAGEIELVIGDAQRAQEMALDELMGAAQYARQANRNPAEILYQLAKHRGYAAPEPEPTQDGLAGVAQAAQPPAAKPAQAPASQQAASRSAQTSKPAPKKQPSPAAQAEAALAGAGGAPASGNTLAAVLEMSERDIAEGKWRKALGGRD